MLTLMVFVILIAIYMCVNYLSNKESRDVFKEDNKNEQNRVKPYYIDDFSLKSICIHNLQII